MKNKEKLLKGEFKDINGTVIRAGDILKDKNGNFYLVVWNKEWDDYIITDLIEASHVYDIDIILKKGVVVAGAITAKPEEPAKSNNNDLIDFPCSDDWQDYYHRKGMTPYNSGRQHDKTQRILEQLLEQNKRIIKILSILVGDNYAAQKGRGKVHRNNTNRR